MTSVTHDTLLGNESLSSLEYYTGGNCVTYAGYLLLLG